MDAMNNTPFAIVVGAFNADGKHAAYSSSGSNVWISAPAGEHGVGSVALVTTDQQGLDRGYGTLHDDPLLTVGSDSSIHDFTSTLDGTGAAAAQVSGAVALMLEVKPDLTFRDVKHVLARTARAIDLDRRQVRVAIGDGPNVLEHAWTTNGAGFTFHNRYGFGAVDVDAAIDMIDEYEPNSLGTFAVTRWIVNDAEAVEESFIIPDHDGRGVSNSLSVAYPVNYETCSDQQIESHCVPEGLILPGPGTEGEGTLLAEAKVNIEAVMVQIRINHPRLYESSVQQCVHTYL